ncbi:hypothetical protein A2960_00980 [Candidatus Gottesmanbacteria bacterium RIFCSPLOWO2_01_FULL_39_12b]|uniref:Glycosyltransferase RgtA/B/C/D-like domain-containing protein n=1 Tax=Candidatus Gottesmanbacteria bacterium RIFCSPLOWO2_01_FULL_39_12b TaxID=1798388 RepID=A0A1F6APV6_9BACT|nr:MAG: hypothetical protein A2960_00980 [Candidatus Gottesmanbacteria bacterium RIFCSPLOWO2_01_FULL_39_12b]
MSKSSIIFILISIFIISTALFFRIQRILSYDVPFNFDHGLTMLEVREIVELKKFRLVGPEGGIKGIFFGPTWYYLIAFIYFVFHGDPRSPAILSTIMNTLCVILALMLGKRISKIFGILLASFFAFSSYLISISANGFVVDVFLLINLIAIWLLLSAQNKKTLLALGLVASLSFHFEPVVAIGFNLALFIILFRQIRNLNIRYKMLLIIVWLIPFLPQVIFDIRHEFLQIHSILKALGKQGADLGGSLPLWSRIPDRLFLLIKQFYQTMGKNNLILTLTLFFYLTRGLLQIKHVKNKTVSLICYYSFLLWLIPFLYYTFLFPPGIKSWYFASFPSFYVLLICLGLFFSFRVKIIRFVSFVTIIFLIIVYSQPSDYLQNINQKLSSQDPSSLINELEAISWIYSDSKGVPFRVYNYSPSVYDYPYQYLFWWYAQKNNLPLPKDFSYRPQTYDYVPNKLSFTPLQKTGNQDFIYLIIQSKDIKDIKYWKLEEFLAPFSNTSVMNAIKFNADIYIEKRRILEN